MELSAVNTSKDKPSQVQTQGYQYTPDEVPTVASLALDKDIDAALASLGSLSFTPERLP